MMRSASSRTVDLGGTRHGPDFGNPMTKRWTSNVIHQKVSITNTKITSLFNIMDLFLRWPCHRSPMANGQAMNMRSLKSGSPMGGVFAKYSVQAVAWLFSKKSGLFFGISRFKKIDTVS